MLPKTCVWYIYILAVANKSKNLPKLVNHVFEASYLCRANNGNGHYVWLPTEHKVSIVRTITECGADESSSSEDDNYYKLDYQHLKDIILSAYSDSISSNSNNNEDYLDEESDRSLVSNTSDELKQKDNELKEFTPAKARSQISFEEGKHALLSQYENYDMKAVWLRLPNPDFAEKYLEVKN